MRKVVRIKIVLFQVQSQIKKLNRYKTKKIIFKSKNQFIKKNLNLFKKMNKNIIFLKSIIFIKENLSKEFH